MDSAPYRGFDPNGPSGQRGITLRDQSVLGRGQRLSALAGGSERLFTGGEAFSNRGGGEWRLVRSVHRLRALPCRHVLLAT